MDMRPVAALLGLADDPQQLTGLDVGAAVPGTERNADLAAVVADDDRRSVRLPLVMSSTWLTRPSKVARWPGIRPATVITDGGRSGCS